MSVSLVPKSVFAIVQPAVQTLASRLFTLSAGRPGSTLFQPRITSFYETGIVTMIYEHLLMTPALRDYEIRHEMKYPGTGGAPKRVDLWLKLHPPSGYPYLIEAGDFEVAKVHTDLAKIKTLNPNGANWFLAFFRDDEELDVDEDNEDRIAYAQDPFSVIEKSLKRKGGLDSSKVRIDKRLTTSFEVYRPNGEHDTFGAALLEGL